MKTKVNVTRSKVWNSGHRFKLLESATVAWSYRIHPSPAFWIYRPKRAKEVGHIQYILWKELLPFRLFSCCEGGPESIWILDFAPLTLTQHISTCFNPFRLPDTVRDFRAVPTAVAAPVPCSLWAGESLILYFFFYRYVYGSFVHTMLYDNADCPHYLTYIYIYLFYILNYICCVLVFCKTGVQHLSWEKTYLYDLMSLHTLCIPLTCLTKRVVSCSEEHTNATSWDLRWISPELGSCLSCQKHEPYNHDEE